MIVSEKAFTPLLKKYPNPKLHLILLSIFSILLIAITTIPLYFYFVPETKIRKEHIYLLLLLSRIGHGGLLSLAKSIKTIHIRLIRKLIGDEKLITRANTEECSEEDRTGNCD